VATKKLSKNPDALTVSTEQRRRWVRNGELAKYLGVSKMTVWRLKHQAGYAFPPAAAINGIEFNDLDKVDAWMEARVQR
jgi:predicted DNA-binding transcriptional regulator AlpA